MLLCRFQVMFSENADFFVNYLESDILKLLFHLSNDDTYGGGSGENGVLLLFHCCCCCL